GWRRFAEQKPTPPVDLTRSRTVPYSSTEQLQLLAGQYRGGLEPPLDREHQKLTGEYWPPYERAAKELEEGQRVKDRAEAGRAWEPNFGQATDAAESRRQDAVQRIDVLRAAAAPLNPLGTWGWVGVVGLVLLGGGSTAAAVRGRGESRRRVLFGLAAV